MPRIALSYRRADSAAIAGRIFDRLTQHYGANSIFMDIDSIPFGMDFRSHIRKTLLDTDIVVVIVGRAWRGLRPDGSARIEQESDVVRIEVETALQRGVPVIPVLVDGATMPTSSELPPSLLDFSFRNAAEVDAGRDFHPHVDRLIRSMDRLLEMKVEAAGASSIARIQHFTPAQPAQMLPATPQPALVTTKRTAAEVAEAPPPAMIVERTAPPAAAATPQRRPYRRWLVPMTALGGLAVGLAALLWVGTRAPGPQPPTMATNAPGSRSTPQTPPPVNQTSPAAPSSTPAPNASAPSPAVPLPVPTPSQLPAGASASAPSISPQENLERGKHAEELGQYASALELYRQAANGGSRAAQYRIGRLYENGWGVAQNYSEAQQWFRKAADQGLPEAEYEVAYAFRNGLGQQKDLSAALEWYLKAADHGYSPAQYAVGLIYADGVGTHPDLDKARQWMAKAAQQGNEDARIWLANDQPSPPAAPKPLAPATTQATPSPSVTPALGPQVASAPALGPGPKQDGKVALERAAREFVDAYFSTWSADNERAMQFVESVYADSVDFYGKTTKRAIIVDAKRKFTVRWPQRKYIVRADEMAINCEAASSICEIKGVVDWNCYSATRSASSTGAAAFELRLSVRDRNNPQILAESGSVISRE